MNKNYYFLGANFKRDNCNTQPFIFGQAQGEPLSCPCLSYRNISFQKSNPTIFATATFGFPVF
jgi:hypothetical protein